jgi:uncharacterized membrane protein
LRWNRRYLIKSYVIGSLWLVPLFAMLFLAVFFRIVNVIELWLVHTGRLDETTGFYGFSATGVRSMLEAVFTLNMSFLVFAFGSLLVAIQVAGGQYTPRIIATTLLRDNAIRLAVGCFVFTMLFSLRELMSLDEKLVPQLYSFLVTISGIISVGAFLYLIDYAARFLRPISLVEHVGEAGIAVIKKLHPRPTERAQQATPPRKLPVPDRTVAHAGNSGIVLAVNLKELTELARDAGGMIEFAPQLGDFLAKDEPLFRVYGSASTLDDAQLQGAVAVGSERTMDQDPTFALRILVDIAIKALSPAINDPTTAVVAIDQLHRLLRLVGQRDLRNEDIRDKRGVPRLIFRTPDWEDFVNLACTEIRHCGVSSIQIVRRMRSMLVNLIETLPPHRHAELRQQLRLLDRAIEAQYTLAEDLALARTPDPQGLGGYLGVQPVNETPAK